MMRMVTSAHPETSPLSGEVSKQQQRQWGILARISLAITGRLEHAFYRYGKLISRTPFLVIFFCLVLTAICCIGIIRFEIETRPFKLWIPNNSEFVRVMEWQEENFQSDLRVNVVIYEVENVLDKSVLLEMLRVHEAVENTKTKSATWESVCAKVPTLSIASFGRQKRDVMEDDGSSLSIKLTPEAPQIVDKRCARQINDNKDNDLDWSLVLPRYAYCEFLESMDEVCLENSILEVFGYDRDFITSLDQQQIITRINTVNTSVVTGFPINITQFLGAAERDAAGHVVKAGASRHTWFTKINHTAIARGHYINDAGTGTQVDVDTYEWEQEFINNILNSSEHPQNVSFYVMASSSFGTVSGDNIQSDLQYLSLGFGIVFIYAVVMLGKFNMVEQRPILSLLGLSCVGLAVGVSFGICSAFNITYGPVNSILPFLLLGLGIDDMFVIMQAWNNLSPQEMKEGLSERVGCALKHAGVSITVTSVTDFVAFAVGSTTALPALRSFCLYAALGIASVYFFQSTFFVACLCIDQKRLEDRRHGLLCCWKLNKWTPNRCSQTDLCQTFFTNVYAKILFLLPVKIFVIVATVVLACVSAWGLSNLRQEFDPIWFLPQDSYLYKFFIKLNYYYPSSGAEGSVFFANISLFTELSNIDTMTKRLKETESIVEVESWYDKYKVYWKKQGYEVPDPAQSEEEFLDQLSQFLFSPSGSPYRNRNFRFSSALNCTQKAPSVVASSIDYRHTLMSTSRQEIKAMESVKTVVRKMNATGYVRAWSRSYGEWETNQVIEEELYRNMGVALVVVLVVTLLLMVSVVTSVLVLVCVLATLVDVGALMHWWGLTIDTVSCIDLVLAVGLCVDYAAHVGHTFMTEHGTRDQRARQTVATIGPAVLNGGFTTFLAFVFLVNSTSHVFLSFFKIFVGVCVYGVYHGLVFLPVLLSMVGPAPYTTHSPRTHPQVGPAPNTTLTSPTHPHPPASKTFTETTAGAGDVSANNSGHEQCGKDAETYSTPDCVEIETQGIKQAGGVGDGNEATAFSRP